MLGFSAVVLFSRASEPAIGERFRSYNAYVEDAAGVPLHIAEGQVAEISVDQVIPELGDGRQYGHAHMVRKGMSLRLLTHGSAASPAVWQRVG